VLLLPWFASMAFTARGVLPTFLFDRLMNLVGATTTMEDIQVKRKMKAKL
jgi:hypothetical protein